MKAKSRESRQGNFLYPDLLDQLNPAHPLLKLAKRIPWQCFEDAFAELYSQAGRPAKRTDKNKVYSLHEPEVLCIGKGKEHKKYEFGRKASLVVTKTTGVIVGALSFAKNIYDGNTLPDVLEQVWQITGRCPQVAMRSGRMMGLSKFSRGPGLSVWVFGLFR